MAFSLLGYIAGFVIGNGSGLDNSRAAQIAVIPGLLGVSLPSLLVTGAVAQQQAKSLTPVLQKIEVDPVFHNYGEVRVLSINHRTFVVSNSGTAELVVTQTTLSGTNADQFA